MKTCPKCNSTRIGHLRLDCDWGDGGDWTPANTTNFEADPNAEYTEKDLKLFKRNERPDIDCYVCCLCSTVFD